MDLINKFGTILYNGETISAKGIELALTMESVSKIQQPLYVRKIGAYFGAIRQKQNKNMSSRR